MPLYQQKIDRTNTLSRILGIRQAAQANPKAIDILNANKDKIDWDVLSGNPNAIYILEANQNKINWEILSANPSIFILK